MVKIWILIGVGAAVLFAGCTDDCTGDLECERVCTTEARAAISLTVTATGASSAVLCSAQVIAFNAEGYVTYAEGFQNQTADNMPSCQFPIAYEQAGTYTVDIQVQDFQAITLENIEVTENRCHVNTVAITEVLQPASSNCHDGYEWVNNACNTPNGCTFPHLERQIIPGIQGAQITYECVDGCLAMGEYSFEMPEAPGRCAALALP